MEIALSSEQLLEGTWRSLRVKLALARGLYQILSVTVFTAQCINITERGNDQPLREGTWRTPYPAHFSKFICLHTVHS